MSNRATRRRPSAARPGAARGRPSIARPAAGSSSVRSRKCALSSSVHAGPPAAGQGGRWPQAVARVASASRAAAETMTRPRRITRSAELDGPARGRAVREARDRKAGRGGRVVDGGPHRHEHGHEVLVRRQRLSDTRRARPVVQQRVDVAAGEHVGRPGIELRRPGRRGARRAGNRPCAGCGSRSRCPQSGRPRAATAPAPARARTASSGPAMAATPGAPARPRADTWRRAEHRRHGRGRVPDPARPARRHRSRPRAASAGARGRRVRRLVVLGREAVEVVDEGHARRRAKCNGWSRRSMKASAPPWGGAARSPRPASWFTQPPSSSRSGEPCAGR